MDLHKINFWKRLEMFVKDVQVNDAMSQEEQEMIIRIAQSEQNSHKHSVMQAEGSEGAKGAAVGQRSVGTVAEGRDCEHPQDCIENDVTMGVQIVVCKKCGEVL